MIRGRWRVRMLSTKLPCVISNLFKCQKYLRPCFSHSCGNHIKLSAAPLSFNISCWTQRNLNSHKKVTKRSQTEPKKLSCAHSQSRLSHTNRQLKAEEGLKRGGLIVVRQKWRLITGLFPPGTKVGGFSTKFFQPTPFIIIRQLN